MALDRPPILRDKTMTDVEGTQRKALEAQPTQPGDEAAAAEEKEEVRSDGKRELRESECYDKLAYCWPRWKKFMYLGVVAAVQVSMNYNTSVFPNAVPPLSEHFKISQQEARTGQLIYLICYSVGCELWAPWSEVCIKIIEPGTGTLLTDRDVQKGIWEVSYSPPVYVLDQYLAVSGRLGAELGFCSRCSWTCQFILPNTIFQLN